jgi:alpha-galactosidase
MSTVGSHVSTVPNHQTGRITPFSTRTVVAMAGVFGYELDPRKLTEEERVHIREDVVRYKKYAKLIQGGDYYRLTNPYESEVGAWAVVSPDKSEAFVSAVMLEVHGIMTVNYLKIKGLAPDSEYTINGSERTYAANALMEVGIPLPIEMGEYQAYQLHLLRV